MRSQQWHSAASVYTLDLGCGLESGLTRGGGEVGVCFFTMLTLLTLFTPSQSFLRTITYDRGLRVKGQPEPLEPGYDWDGVNRVTVLTLTLTRATLTRTLSDLHRTMYDHCCKRVLSIGSALLRLCISALRVAYYFHIN